MTYNRFLKIAGITAAFALATVAVGTGRAATLSSDPTSITLSAAPGGQSDSQTQGNITLYATARTSIRVAAPSWLTIYADRTSLDAATPLPMTFVGDASNYSSPTTLNGTVTITPTQGTPLNISVTFNIGTPGGGTPTTTLVPSQTSVTFNYPPGTSGTNSVQITVNAASGATTSAFSAVAATQSGGQWLLLVCQSSCANQAVGSQVTLKVDSAVGGTLSTGSYHGTVTLTNTASSTDKTAIDVTLSVTQGSTTPPTTLAPSQTNVSFSYGATACGTTATQITVSASSSNTTSFSAVAATQSGGQWLILTCQGNCTSQPVGSQLTLTVDPSVAKTLSTGVYQGTVTLTNTASSDDSVTLNVALAINTAITTGTSTGTLAGPSSLSFIYAAGYTGALPFQTILINGANPTVLQSNNGSFPCGTGINYALTGNTVLVTIAGNGFQVGNTYSGSITVGSSLGTQTIPIALTTYTGATLFASPGTITCQPSQGICPGNVISFQMSDSSTRPLNLATPVSWLSLTGCGATTPTSCTVAVSQDGLTSGLNTGVITAIASGASNGSITVPVVVLTSGVLSLSNNSLSFTTNSIQQKSVTVSADGAVNFGITFGVETPSGGDWLSVNASSTTTPATVTVTVNAAGLAPGDYPGHITLTGADSTPQTVTVRLTVPPPTGGNVSVSSPVPISSLSFLAQAGGTVPAAQQVMITNASGSSSIAFTYSTDGPWLLVNNSQTGQLTTPATLSVSVNPADLLPGIQNGTITITPAGGQTVKISVSVTVTPPISVSAAPASLSLTYVAGAASAPTALIQVSGNGGTLPFTAVAASTGNWLVVSPKSGTTLIGDKVPLTVSLGSPGSLAPSGTPYIGTVTIAGTNGAAGVAVVYVSVTVLPALPTVLKVANGASLNSGSISAGEIITVLGTAMGPDVGVALSQDLIVNSQIPTTLAGVQVFVNGFPAPMLYAGSTQISCVVPYEIQSSTSPQNATLQVKYLGQASNGFPLTQTATAPGIFTAASTGSGPGQILNADGSLNFWRNPANRGDPVMLYVTGEGQTDPAGISGRITPAVAPIPKPILAPTVTIGGQAARVLFYGEAPGVVAGTLQINVEVPLSAPSGELPVVVSFGTACSQLTADGTGAVTISVR